MASDSLGDRRVLTTAPTANQVLTWNATLNGWAPATPTVYAPTTVDYLVGTATGALSAEIVVGTAPGGELGGTWASPTVDTTHSGSSHAGLPAGATVGGAFLPTRDSSGRSTAQTAAVASVVADTHSGDSTLMVCVNVLVTTSTTHNFTVTVAYTDEGGTPRTLTLPFAQLAGTIITAITNVTGAGPYEGVPVVIRVQSGSTTTIATTGVFTTVTYNVEARMILLDGSG